MLRRSRHGYPGRGPNFLASALIVTEIESLVLQDRAADGTAKLAVERCRQATLRLVEWIACLLGVAAAVVESAAVDGVGAGFGLCSYDSRDGLSEFCVVALCGQLGFGDRFQRWIDNDLAENWILVCRAIEFICNAGKVLAVDLYLTAALWVFCAVL